MKKRYVAGPNGEGSHMVVNIVDQNNDYAIGANMGFTKDNAEEVADALNREYEFGYKAAQKDMREAIGIDDSVGHTVLGGVVF